MLDLLKLDPCLEHWVRLCLAFLFLYLLLHVELGHNPSEAKVAEIVKEVLIQLEFNIVRMFLIVVQ